MDAIPEGQQLLATIQNLAECYGLFCLCCRSRGRGPAGGRLFGGVAFLAINLTHSCPLPGAFATTAMLIMLVCLCINIQQGLKGCSSPDQQNGGKVPSIFPHTFHGHATTNWQHPTNRQCNSYLQTIRRRLQHCVWWVGKGRACLDTPFASSVKILMHHLALLRLSCNLGSAFLVLGAIEQVGWLACSGLLAVALGCPVSQDLLARRVEALSTGCAG